MKWLDEFRKRELAEKLLPKIEELAREPVNIMDVCGTHTVAIFRHGIKDMLPANITLLSGPGCPVCVTPPSEIDKAIVLSRQPGVLLVTFGDMMRVPGNFSRLENERARGAQIKVVYSVQEALNLAMKYPLLKVVFLAIGFETTSPTVASVIMEAYRQNILNLFFLNAHKLIPPAMGALLDSKEINIHGFLCPGHVSTIIGSRPYEFIPQDYGIPCVISGFEPLDILQSIYLLLKQRTEGEAKVEIQYQRCVKPEGNIVAQQVLQEVFEIDGSFWRGLGYIPRSGLKLREKYAHLDVERAFDLDSLLPKEIPQDVREETAGCLCGEILRGTESPPQCPLFATTCTPYHPVGACMVSSEGTCATYYKYHYKVITSPRKRGE